MKPGPTLYFGQPGGANQDHIGLILPDGVTKVALSNVRGYIRLGQANNVDDMPAGPIAQMANINGSQVGRAIGILRYPTGGVRVNLGLPIRVGRDYVGGDRINGDQQR